MKFKIIPNQQTPKIEDYKDVALLIIEDGKLLSKFIAFARLQHDCVGLAANQVSCDGERIMQPFFAVKKDRYWDLIVHPRILSYHGKREIKEEGCLTWIGKKIKAMRYPRIHVSYFNLNGEHFELTITGFEAQVWQHECCHLLGIKEEIIERRK